MLMKMCLNETKYFSTNLMLLTFILFVNYQKIKPVFWVVRKSVVFSLS